VSLLYVIRQSGRLQHRMGRRPSPQSRRTLAGYFQSDLKTLFPGRLEHYRGVEVASEPFFRIVKSGNGVSLTRIASD
jgi:hypothetical protein